MRFRPNSPRLLLLALGVAGVCAAACSGKIGGQSGTGASGGGPSGTAGAGNPAGVGNATGAGSSSGAGGAGSSPTNLTCAQVGADSSAAVMRRLSNLEYQLTLQDLFQLSSAARRRRIPPDVDRDGFRTYATIQSVSAQHLRAYIDRAHALADELMADTARRTRVLGCEPTASGCLRAFAGRSASSPTGVRSRPSSWTRSSTAPPPTRSTRPISSASRSR